MGIEFHLFVTHLSQNHLISKAWSEREAKTNHANQEPKKMPPSPYPILAGHGAGHFEERLPAP